MKINLIGPTYKDIIYYNNEWLHTIGGIWNIGYYLLWKHIDFNYYSSVCRYDRINTYFNQFSFGQLISFTDKTNQCFINQSNRIVEHNETIINSTIDKADITHLVSPNRYNLSKSQLKQIRKSELVSVDFNSYPSPEYIKSITPYIDIIYSEYVIDCPTKIVIRKNYPYNNLIKTNQVCQFNIPEIKNSDVCNVGAGDLFAILNNLFYFRNGMFNLTEISKEVSSLLEKRKYNSEMYQWDYK